MNRALSPTPKLKSWSHTIIIIIIVRAKKFCSLSPFRVMGRIIQTWHKSIKFVRDGKEQQQ